MAEVCVRAEVCKRFVRMTKTTKGPWGAAHTTLGIARRFLGPVGIRVGRDIANGSRQTVRRADRVGTDRSIVIEDGGGVGHPTERTDSRAGICPPEVCVRLFDSRHQALDDPGILLDEVLGFAGIGLKVEQPEWCVFLRLL